MKPKNLFEGYTTTATNIPGPELSLEVLEEAYRKLKENAPPSLAIGISPIVPSGSYCKIETEKVDQPWSDVVYWIFDNDPPDIAILINPMDWPKIQPHIHWYIRVVWKEL